MNTHHKPERSRWIEAGLFVLALLAANIGLFAGRASERLIFFPGSIRAGEWWRAMTFPFAHVSWYHLAMDGGAFLWLYLSFTSGGRVRRLLGVAACAAGSLAASVAASPLAGGLCGLSGIAHGLMAIVALAYMDTSDRTVRNAGLVCFLVVVIKSMLEAITGHVVFEALHFGLVDSPVAVCHAGGVLAGVCFHAMAAQTAGAQTAGLIRRRETGSMVRLLHFETGIRHEYGRTS